MDRDPTKVPLAELDRLWDFDDPEGSERRFAELVPRARDEHEGAFLTEVLTQLARAQGLQGRFDEAQRTLTEADRALRPHDRRGSVRLLLERGRVDRSAKRNDLGRRSFREAWELGRSAGEDGLAVDAAHMLGIVEPPQIAKEWNERAMELARSSPDPAARRWLGTLANNMGWVYHDASDYDQALALFKVALEERRRDGTANQVRIARWCVARCRRSLGRVEEALLDQQALAAELEAEGEVDGYVDEELAECLLALGRGAHAHAHFSRAFAELSGDAELQANEPERLERLRSLGSL